MATNNSYVLNYCNSPRVRQADKDWTTDKITQIFVLF